MTKVVAAGRELSRRTSCWSLRRWFSTLALWARALELYARTSRL